MLTNCKSSLEKEDNTSDKAQDTEDHLANTPMDTVKVLQDRTTAYQKFIAESETRINIYEKEITDLKIKIAEEKKTEKSKYEQKLAQLEQKNEMLKTKIIDYKDKQIDNWDAKQLEFRKDMDDLGNAISDFFVKEE